MKTNRFHIGSAARALLAKPLVPLAAVALFLAGWWFGLPPRETADAGADGSATTIWTCSMHPQIRQPNPGLCPICAMDLIQMGDAPEGGLRTVQIMPEAAALLDIRVSPVVHAPAETEVHLFGRIAYDERRVVTTTARMGGRLDRLYVDFTGTLVREGDHLAEIYSPDLYVAQQELIQATQAMAGAPPGTLDTRRRLVTAAREKLRLLGLTEAQIDEIAAKQAPSDHITLTAPQDGIVVRRDAVEGQYVKTGDALFAVADLATVWLYLEAYESDLQWIRFAQDVTFTIDALPGREFHGRVAFIDPQLDPVRRIVRVRVNVPNPDQALKPGMFARATLRSSVAGGGRVLDASLAGKWISPMHPEIIKDAPGQCDICGMDLVPAEQLGFVASVPDAAAPLVVPASAVLRTGDRSVVYVRVPNEEAPTFDGREIVLGPRVGDRFIVERGLREGELVVTRGAFSLDSELQINAKPSMMNRNAGIEEVPANSAPRELAGQWEPVLRALGRATQAATTADGDPAQVGAATRSALATMAGAVEAVQATTVDPDTAKLWEEFSNRLLNNLAIAAERTSTAPVDAVEMAGRAVEETGRFVGLPFQPVVPDAALDPRWFAPLRDALSAYFPVANALAHDDPAAAAAAVPALVEAASRFPDPEAAASLQDALAALSAAGTEVKVLREALLPTTNALAQLVREHGADHVGDVYVVHCPMAFDDQGADWLAAKPVIENPYFGDEMFACGAVSATLSREPAEVESIHGNQPHPAGHEGGQSKEVEAADPHAEHRHDDAR